MCSDQPWCVQWDLRVHRLWRPVELLGRLATGERKAEICLGKFNTLVGVIAELGLCVTFNLGGILLLDHMVTC